MFTKTIHDPPTIPEHIQAKRIILRKQLADLSAARDVETVCPGCGEAYSVLDLFRCRECAIWYCRCCALEHFGIAEPAAIAIIEVTTDES